MDLRKKLPASLVSPFKKEFDLNNSLVIAALAESLRFVRRVSSAEYLLDTQALILAVLAVGQEHSSQQNDASPLAWLVEWIEEHRYSFSASLVASDNQADREGVQNILVDEALRDGPLREAASLAQTTVRSGRSGVRQLTLALTRAGQAWSSTFNPPMPHAAQVALRSHLVERMIERSEEEDLSEGWGALRRDADVDFNSKSAAPPNKDCGVPVAPIAGPETLRTVADEPAKIDQLGRTAFARVLAERLTHAREPADDTADASALMVHVNGPWGYGKSSVLNLLRDELQTRDKPWLVIDFNAWKHQRLRPPWWSLLTSLYASAVDGSGRWQRMHLRWVWWGWRARADWLPTLLAAAILVAAAVGLIRMLAEPGAQVVAGLLTVAAGLFAYMRLVMIGSAKAAAVYSEMKADPLDPIITLYGRLVAAADRPVAVFIDDLDRCSSSYVVELIEGIQTLFRSQAVTYVVAADRAWIASAFEEQYSQFSRVIGEPGRPLGYLFLDKLFQISVSLPDLSSRFLESYWRNLLSDDTAQTAPAISSEAADERVRGKHSIEALQQIITTAPESEQAALRAAAAVQISRPGSTEHIEHRLQVFAPLIEANPRAMKRLVNAVGLAQARCLLEGRAASLGDIARWSMIELRWPLLAEHLGRHPADIEGRFGPDSGVQDDRAVLGLLTDPKVQAILRANDMPVFGEASLRALIS